MTTSEEDTAKWSRSPPSCDNASTAVHVMGFCVVSRTHPSSKLFWKEESLPPWIRIFPSEIKTAAKATLGEGKDEADAVDRFHDRVGVSSIQMLENGSNIPCEGL